VINLRKDDVDFQQGQLRVLGKGNRERIVPMSLHIMKIYEKYLAFERPENCSSSNFFVVLQGKRSELKMTPAGLRSLFRYRRLKTNILRAKPHQFRHTYGLGTK